MTYPKSIFLGILMFVFSNLAIAEIVIINQPDGNIRQCIVNQGVVTCF